MKFRYLLIFTLLGPLSLSASAETTVKILHLQKLPKALAIWQEAAQTYEKAHPGVKIVLGSRRLRREEKTNGLFISIQRCS